MADNTIDSLALEISSNSAGAEKALDKLAGSLARLQKSMNLVSNSKLGGFNAAIKNLKDSLTGFSGVGNLEKGITQIQRLSRLNSDGLSKAAVGLTEVSDALKGMNGISIPNLDGLELFIANIRKFGGKNVGAATKNLSVIARDLVNLVSELNQVGAITFDFSGLQSLVQSISNLGLSKAVNATKNMKTLKEQLLRFISGLNGIGKLNFDVSGLNELVTALSKLGYSAALKAPTNIRELADSMRYLLSTLSQAPNVSQNVIQMANAMAQLAASGGRAGVASKALANGFNIIPASASKARKGFSGLAGAIGKFYATYWLLIRALGGFRKAIDISSDLTEVQNVVDVTFGEMSDTINDFAKSALQNYGMSELMAKQIASRFQAMGVSMGFAQGKMSEMSIELTKLAGDMASFYNESQQGVAKALQSIFTGETEPLRRFGLDLSFATVEAWALAQGIDADMRKMTQAEKTMLRYQYVLANTGAAASDFQRTINSWHNQLVLLSGGFQQLASIVGGVLINAFKPFIQALNSVMGAVINFAQVVSDALGAIFGWEYQTGGGVAQDLETGAGAAGGIENAMGGAADKAKEMNKYIAGWHELNIMNTNNDSGGSGGGASGGGVSGGSGADGGNWVQKESLWEKYTSSIDTLYELGEYISGVLTDAMNHIDWDKVYESARNFGLGLASFLNGLISPDLFGATGRTIAGALNTAIYAALSFGETFDWSNFGESIASGINNFFATFDFGTLANTIDTWVHGILDTAITAVKKIKWDKIGEKIGEFLQNLDFTKTLKKVGKLIWEGINAAIETYKGMLKTAPFETAFFTVLTSAKLLRKIKVGAKSLTNSISNILSTGLSVALGNLSAGFSTGLIFEGLVDSVKFSVKEIQTELSKLNGISKITIGAGTVLGEVALIKNGISDLISGPSSFANVALSIGQIGVAAVAAKTVLVGVFGAAGPVVAAISGIVAAFMGIDDAMDKAAGNSSIGKLSQEISDLSDTISNKSGTIKKQLIGIKEDIETAGTAEANMARDLAAEYQTLSDKTSLSASEKERLKTISEQLVGIIPELQSYIDEETGALDIQKGSLDALITGYESLAQKQAAQSALVDAYKAQYAAQMNVKNATDGYNKAFNEYLANAGLAPEVIKQVENGQLDLNQAFIDFENSPKNFLQKYGVKDYGTLKKAINGLNEEMQSYNSVLEDAKNTEKLAGENIDYLNGKIEETDQKYKESLEIKRADTMATDEYKQSLSDLSTEFDRLGISISDSMKQELVLEEFDISSLNTFFESIENGVQQSSSGLQKAFSDLGLSLPDDLANAIANKSPEVQSETVKILMSIQSGLKANEGQLKTLFTNLGMDLPDTIITNLANKEASMQTAVTNLLSKMESGYTLKAGSLKTIFSGLGIEVPDSLIASLENQEAPTQQEAIKLLSQIQTASDEQRKPLIDNLEKLGIDVSGIYNTGLASHNDDIKNTSEEMRDNTKQPLKDEFSSSDSGDMYEYGANASKGFWQGVKDWWDDSWLGRKINEFKQAISGPSGLDEHSPSKVMELFGIYAIEGFNIGLADEMPKTYSLIGDWVDKVKDFGSISLESPKLNTYIPKPDLTPTSYDLGKFKSTMQMEMDARIAEQQWEIRQQNELLREQNELLRGIYEKPVLTDDDVFNATRRGQNRFQRRTFRTGWAGID